MAERTPLRVPFKALGKPRRKVSARFGRNDRRVREVEKLTLKCV
jgi:hypothetical protein